VDASDGTGRSYTSPLARAVFRLGQPGGVEAAPGSSTLILITGIPAMGKTTMGDHLRDVHGFLHLNFEGVDLWEYVPNGFAIDAGRVEQLRRDHPRVAITWGFVPDAQLGAVLALTERRSN
jgi:hypothetical protein